MLTFNLALSRKIPLTQQGDTDVQLGPHTDEEDPVDAVTDVQLGPHTDEEDPVDAVVLNVLRV